MTNSNSTYERITRGDATMLYATAHGSYAVRLHLRLDRTIDENALRSSVDKTAERYPYLCVSLKKNEKEFYYVENKLPIAIGHTASPLKLGTDEANGHVWSISYEEDRLFLDFYHGKTDGTGAYQLLTTLLYYYFTEQGYSLNPTGIKTLDTAIDVSEINDPLERLPLVDLSKIEFPAPVTALNLMKESDLERSSGKGMIYRLLIPEESFLPFTKENDASPGIMVSVLMARAIERLHPDHDAPIVSNYIVNARPMLGAEDTLHNCTGRVVLNYDEKVRKMSLERQCTIYRGKTILQSDEETVRGMMTVAATMSQTILDLPDLQTKMSFARQSMESTYDAATYMVSYVGRWKHPEIGEHIREFWTETPVGTFPLIEMAAVNGNICVSILQPFEEDLYFKELKDELESNGIEYTDCGHAFVSVADIDMENR